MGLGFTRQVLGQRTADRLSFHSRTRGSLRRDSVLRIRGLFRLARFQLFQLEFQLLDP